MTSCVIIYGHHIVIKCYCQELTGIRNEWRLVPLVFYTTLKGRLKTKEAAIEFV